MNYTIFKHTATGTSGNTFTAAAIGGAVGGAVFLISLFLLCFVIHRVILANKKRRYSSIHRMVSTQSSISTTTVNGPHCSCVAELVNMKTNRSMTEEQARTGKKLVT